MAQDIRTSNLRAAIFLHLFFCRAILWPKLEKATRLSSSSQRS
uniref:Uncharacterized protein n=1 Tax=Anguilla anguilla TaxID=7936 RepID=A0A0E9XA67_ANGAN